MAQKYCRKFQSAE